MAKRSDQHGGRPLPTAFFIVDEAPGDRVRRAIDRLAPGVAVLYRDYDNPDRAGAARALRRLTRARACALFIAGDRRLALAIRADGLHLPAHRLMRGGFVRRTRPLTLTAACHSIAALHRAAAAGVDGVLLSPVFATASHPGAPPLGAHRFIRLARVAAIKGLAVFALGGMSAARARHLAAAPLAGYAAIGHFLEESNGNRIRN